MLGRRRVPCAWCPACPNIRARQGAHEKETALGLCRQGHGHGYGHGLRAAERVLLRVDCKTAAKLLLCGAGSRTSRLEDWDRQRH